MPLRLVESPVDLFGEVPVTLDDIELWLRAIPRMDPTTRRAAYYVQAYNVADKIRRAKLEGWFYTLKPAPAPTGGTIGRLPFDWPRQVA